ncbi:hypothetical protein B5C34_14785 [Pacificimonas flava]|uniref:Phytoene synthase n=2 Tax=Pacificimonas TaxID=1960290 RepID=A0A219B0C1_9SPHN|nr:MULTISPECIES: phytoene/squalene synthase family protein [Pacificimonas]MBZ6379771.1 phytoene/squalene synthase family protein [Pacificimonas aurantium]OWV31775.1 hypothetical protein B5C34_14785 [Pacificimonas flava]
MTSADLDKWAARSIAKGSKSFALASRLFDAETKRRVRLLYAWCRHCDDVIDGQHLGMGEVESDLEPAERLDILRRRTKAGLDDPASETGAFAAIGAVALECGLPHQLPLRHLHGFAMDVHDRRYRTIEDVLDYCEHVAGVVGRMMAIVMGVEADNKEVLARAADLGIAFQLTNICRDVVEDAARDRCYLPTEWLVRENLSPGEHARPENRLALSHVTERMLGLADRYYASAKAGATHLPFEAAWAVLTAKKVYRAIGDHIRDAGPEAWDERQRTGLFEKLGMLAAARQDAKADPVPVPLSGRGDLWRFETSEHWREPAPLMAAAEAEQGGGIESAAGRGTP